MGCDIQAVIEYRDGDSFFAFSELHLERDYAFFSAIAFGDGGITDDLPFPPRGLPFDFSFEVFNLFFISAEDYSSKHLEYFDEPAPPPKELAAGWGAWAEKVLDEYGSVPTFDIHTPSWLNFNELAQALEAARYNLESAPPTIRAAHAAMAALAECFEPIHVRIVYWFSG